MRRLSALGGRWRSARRPSGQKTSRSIGFRRGLGGRYHYNKNNISFMKKFGLGDRYHYKNNKIIFLIKFGLGGRYRRKHNDIGFIIKFDLAVAITTKIILALQSNSFFKTGF